MSVERILAHSVEKGDLLVLFRREASDGVVAHRISKLDLIHGFDCHELLITGKLINLSLVVEPARFLWVYRLDKVFLPVKILLIMILLWCLRLLKSMLGHIPVRCDGSLG